MTQGVKIHFDELARTTSSEPSLELERRLTVGSRSQSGYRVSDNPANKSIEDSHILFEHHGDGRLTVFNMSKTQEIWYRMGTLSQSYSDINHRPDLSSWKPLEPNGEISVFDGFEIGILQGEEIALVTAKIEAPNYPVPLGLLFDASLSYVDRRSASSHRKVEVPINMSMTVGRHPKSHLLFNNLRVSSHHGHLSYDGKNLRYTHHGTHPYSLLRGGSQIFEENLTDPTELHHGDNLLFVPNMQNEQDGPVLYAGEIKVNAPHLSNTNETCVVGPPPVMINMDPENQLD